MSIVNMRLHNDAIIDWSISPKYSDEVVNFLSDIGDKYHYKFFYQECVKEDNNEKLTAVFFELDSSYSEWLEKYFKPCYKGRPNEYYLFEDYSETYLMFKIDNEGVFGLKEYDGNIQWKQLKLFRFLMNRFEEDEKLVNQIIEDFRLVQTMSEVLIVENMPLVEGYNETTVSSCMQNNGSYFEFLQQNTNSCLLTFKLGSYEGRAILWREVDGLPTNCKGLVDRIYPSDNHTLVNSVIRWATANNYMTKAQQNYGNKEDFIFKGDLYSNQDFKLKLACPLSRDDEMPYMDTFSYYTEGDNYISNREGDYTFNSTSGEGIGGCRCEDCGERFHEDDMSYVEGVGYVCEHCIEQYNWCQDVDHYVFHQDTYYCETNGYYYADNTCLIEINDRYYHEADDGISYCEHCNYYFFNTDTDYIHDVDGNIICKDCYDEYVQPQDDENEYYYKHNLYEDEDGRYWTSEKAYLIMKEEEEDETRTA